MRPKVPANPGPAVVSRMAAPRNLAGKIALVTGASHGIGFAVAKALAREGAKLVITGRDQKALQAAERALKQALRGKRTLAPQNLSCTADVRQPKSVQALFADIKEHFARLDIVINNAGISHAMA